MTIRTVQNFHPVVIARRSASLTLTNASTNNLVFDIEALDLYNCWNGTTFTTPVAGLYKFDANVNISFAGSLTSNDIFLILSVNGSAPAGNRFGARFLDNTSIGSTNISGCIPAVSLSVSDAVIIQLFISATGASSVSIPVSSVTSLLISFLG